jgi:CubicO group peptidase (beta-lactamase class C family)
MPNLDRRIDALFEPWDRPDSPGCALGIVQDGQLVYHRVYGMADLERDVPLKPASVFDIGSTGKQFTALLIALLAHQGKLTLDDPVQKYVPELPQYDHPITIRHLIHHTSGLRDYLELLFLSGQPLDRDYKTDELLALICRQRRLNFIPGDEYLYSNTGYLLLGVIAERVAQTPFTELLRTTFFAPLAMQSSDINDDVRRVIKNRALSYTQDETGAFRTEIPGAGGFGDGPILSTIEDLVRWDQNFYSNILGGGSALIEQVCTSGQFNNGEAIGYGFGLAVSSYRGLRSISHGGAWAGFRSELMRFPDQRCSIICLANLGTMQPSQLAKQVADIYLADLFQDTAPTELTDDTGWASAFDLTPYTGWYQHPRTQSLLELSAVEGAPVAALSGYAIQFSPFSGHRWRSVNFPFTLHLAFSGTAPELILSGELSNWRQDVYRRLNRPPATPETLREAAGDYTSEELSVTYRVETVDDQLYLRLGSAAPLPLRAVCKDVCLLDGLTLTFVRDDANRIRELEVSGSRARHISLRRL